MGTKLVKAFYRRLGAFLLGIARLEVRNAVAVQTTVQARVGQWDISGWINLWITASRSSRDIRRVSRNADHPIMVVWSPS